MFKFGPSSNLKQFSSTAVTIPESFTVKKRKSLSLSNKNPKNNGISQRDKQLKEILGSLDNSNSSPSMLINYFKEKKASQECKENMEQEEICSTPPGRQIDSCEVLSGKYNQHKHIMDKVMRDYNSPSAAARNRAAKAIKSESFRKANYEIFDLPCEEMDLLTEEERNIPPPVVKTLKEVMSRVKVHVEVRNGSDNRSEGIKKAAFDMGAKIHEKIYKDTTHVIFKEGLQSTYNKAKALKIPVVNVLWLDSCKKYNKIVDSKLFNISNLDRYENPEMHKRIRRQKSMQPDLKFDYTTNMMVSGKEVVSKIDSHKITLKPVVQTSSNEKETVVDVNDKSDLNVEDEFQSTTFDSLDEYVQMVPKIAKTPVTVNKPATPKSNRRRTMFHTSTLQSSVINEETESDDMIKPIENSKTDTPSNIKNISNLISGKPIEDSLVSMEVSRIDTPTVAGRYNRLQSSLFTPQSKEPTSVSMDISKIVTPVTPYQGATTRRRSNIFTPQPMISTPIINVPTLGTSTATRIKNSNYTLLTPCPMDMTNNVTSVTSLTKQISLTDLDDKPTVPSNSGRRSLFSHNQPSESIAKTTFNSAKQAEEKAKRSRRSMDIISMQVSRMNEEITQKENPWIPKKALDNGSAKKGGEQIVVLADVHREDPRSQPILTQPIQKTSVIKKRKLFSLDDEDTMMMTPPAKKPIISRTNKRRSIAAIPITSTSAKKVIITPKTPISTQKDLHGRRTTMFFETPDAMIKRKLAIQSASKPLAAVKAQKLVFTNMHSPEIAVIKEAIYKLGQFEIEDTVSDETSHLVTMDNNRTMNILRGIIRGIWILSFDWITASLAADRWLYEEPFEFLECSPVIQRLRSEKKTLGGLFKNDLFLSLPAFYVSSESIKNVKLRNLKELIKSCRGRLADNVKYSKFIITEKYLTEDHSAMPIPNFNVEKEKIVQLHPHFLFDSICQNRILPYGRYSVKVKEPKKEPGVVYSQLSQCFVSQVELPSQIL